MALPKQADDASKEEKIEFDTVGNVESRAAETLIHENFKIDRIVGLIKLNDGSFMEAESGACICVLPRTPSELQYHDKKESKYCTVSLTKQKAVGFDSVIGNTAGAHQLIFVSKNKKWIATIGRELSHICHRHNCINTKHMEWEPHSDNQHRETSKSCGKYFKSKRWNFAAALDEYGLQKAIQCPHSPKCVIIARTTPITNNNYQIYDKWIEGKLGFKISP